MHISVADSFTRPLSTVMRLLRGMVQASSSVVMARKLKAILVPTVRNAQPSGTLFMLLRAILLVVLLAGCLVQAAAIFILLKAVSQTLGSHIFLAGIQFLLKAILSILGCPIRAVHTLIRLKAILRTAVLTGCTLRTMVILLRAIFATKLPMP